MHNLDYELGLVSDDAGYENAIGDRLLGNYTPTIQEKYRMELLKCNTICASRHPFSSKKRNACKATCQADFDRKSASLLIAEKFNKVALTQQMGNIATKNYPTIDSSIYEIIGTPLNKPRTRKPSLELTNLAKENLDEKLTDEETAAIIIEEESFFDKNKMLIIGAGAIAAIFIGMRFMK